MIHIKNKTEIQKMRDAGRLAAEVLHETGQRVAAGVSTLELNNFAHKFTLSRGARSAPLNYRGFPRSICTSINNVVCHGIPDKNDVLKPGDILNIDITVILNGFHGDTSRMFVIEPIPEQARQLIQDTEKSMFVGIETIQPDGRISDIGAAIDDFLSPRGYGIVRDLTGHGIGRNFHEDPSVPHYRQSMITERMRPGMTFTVEPMVNTGTFEVYTSQEDGWTVFTKDGSLSAQFEHTCLVTDHGYEILTVME
ncbi:MAG: type I methionyl aminopeptidase [Leptospiraceae bacterium]|nr:type I methionyl aminopeptidase [Leptospiraceae bacterium]